MSDKEETRGCFGCVFLIKDRRVRRVGMAEDGKYCRLFPPNHDGEFSVVQSWQLELGCSHRELPTEYEFVRDYDDD